MDVVPVHPIDERVTGFVGLVVQPDPDTIRTAYDLAAATVRDDAEMRLGPGQLPHVTLTQCALRDAPRPRIVDFAARLTRQLSGARIPLSTITTFPGGFVVTLGFDPRLATGAAPAAGSGSPHVMAVERVVLARFGRHGRVEEICV